MDQASLTDAAIEGFASIGQPTRLHALRRLLSVYPESLLAGEIARHCDVPHNTMSNHLSVLARAGLVAAERNGRTVSYRAGVAAFRGLIDFLAHDCCDGKPELCGHLPVSAAASAPELSPDIVAPAFNVLFLCTQNSARSIMAEALLRKIGRGRFHAYSAGSNPAEAPLPEVVDRLKHLGHDVTHLHCKSWNEFTGPEAPRMDFVIALCDTPQGQFCPDLGTKFVTGAWPVPDPIQFTGSASERMTLLNELYAMIRRRLEIFVNLPFASLDRVALKARLDEIGDTNRISP